jgi:protein gp37
MLEWSKVAFDSIPTVRCMELEQVGKSVQDVDYIEGQKNRWPWPLRNVWLGVSVENQRAADERIPLLLETPAAIRWISAEPLLGPVRLDWLGPDGSRHAGLNALTGEQRGPHEAPDESEWGDSRIDWVVAGGESGPDARPSHPDWFRGLRDQCQAAQVPFFFKQHGEWLHESQSGENLWAKFAESGTVRGNVGRHQEFGGYTYRVGKKAAGRELDGRTWDEYPK